MKLQFKVDCLNDDDSVRFAFVVDSMRDARALSAMFLRYDPDRYRTRVTRVVSTEIGYITAADLRAADRDMGDS